ncbi:beta-aspartyl-peptidase [Clostridium hydrogeniformans]|uniref:beta-aspartyl-peptidase n=1 Tax=Clostridium hydrogeniformans TaxID=349933 RepID=UPI000484EDAE|nr:beta-aspartyl-peptidase [Clostridium hydrogeniformans]
MVTVIKDIEVYSPEYLGKKTIVIVDGKIEGVYDSISIPEDFISIREIEGDGMILMPGFIDAHVHISGGGGEGSFKTRTPEIKLSELIEAGITTVVGCIGTDGICRDMKSLLAKAYALEEEGITSYVYTGSYEIPVRTIMSSIKEDIMLIPKIIGVGEVALSDHRSSQPTFEQFISLAADARVAGLLSGKAGIVHVHLGDGPKKFQYMWKLIENTEIPINQIVPTHCNRSIHLFKDAIEHGKKGGYVDLTTSSDPDFLEEDEVKASRGLKMLLEEGVKVENIMFSSDGQGSLPKFNKNREFIGLGIGSVSSLYREVRDAVLNDGISLEMALKTITSNVADCLKLNDKGRIAKGKSADLIIARKEDLTIEGVLSKGVECMRKNKILIKGTFE